VRAGERGPAGPAPLGARGGGGGRGGEKRAPPALEGVIAMIEHEYPDRAREPEGERSRLVWHADGRSRWPRQDITLDVRALARDEVANGVEASNGRPQQDGGRDRPEHPGGEQQAGRARRQQQPAVRLRQDEAEEDGEQGLSEVVGARPRDVGVHERGGLDQGEENCAAQGDHRVAGERESEEGEQATPRSRRAAAEGPQQADAESSGGSGRYGVRVALERVRGSKQ